MNNNLLNEFKNDFYNLVKVEDILVKYSISKSTYFVMIKKLGLKRERSSKMMRTFNMNLSQTDNKPKELEQKPKPNYIPKKIEPKTDVLDDQLVYDKQFVPRNTEIVVDKTKPKQVVKKQFKEVDNNELDAILNRADKTFTKIQNKKQSKITENKNK
jgi:hypothetical protein